MLAQKKSWKELNHQIWPCRHWLGNILEFSSEPFHSKNIQEFFVLRPAGWSEEASVVCWTEFWSGTSTFLGQTRGSEGEGAIRKLEVFLSSKRIWLKNVQVSRTSDNCSILLCSSLFQKKYWWIVPVPEGNQSWICDFHNSEPVWSKLVRYW